VTRQRKPESAQPRNTDHYSGSENVENPFFPD